MARFRLAVFRADVTPPIGHPLCGYEPTDSFVSPAGEALLRAAIADLLEAR